MSEKCKCQDSEGVTCGKEMTSEEVEQDGMCWKCADHVWNEMDGGDTEYYWTHDSRNPPV